MRTIEIRTIVLCLILFLPFVTFAQTQVDLRVLMADPNANYHQVVAYGDSLFAGGGPVSSTGPIDEALAKEFGRWQEFWHTRLYDSAKTGDRTWANLALSEFYKTGNQCEIPGKNPVESWVPMGPFGDSLHWLGRVQSVFYHPNWPKRLYIGSQTGGLFRTQDFTVTNPVWENVTDLNGFPGCGIFDIVSSPDGKDIFLATGSDLYQNYSIGMIKSTDYGQNWNLSTLTFNASEKQELRKLLLHPEYGNPNSPHQNTIYALTPFEVFFTTDGTSWNKLGFSNFPNYKTFNLQDMAFVPGTFKLLIGGFELFIYDPKGQPSPCPGAQLSPQIKLITQLLSDPIPYEVTNGDQFRDIRISTPFPAVKNSGIYFFYKAGGLTYSTRIDKMNGSCSTFSNYYSSIILSGPIFEVSPGDSTRMYMENKNRMVCRIEGNSNSLTILGNLHNDIRSIQLINGNTQGQFEGILVGSDGGIMYALNPPTNSRANWQSKNGIGLNITQFWKIGGHPALPNYIYGGSQDNSGHIYQDGNWSHNILGDHYESVIDANKPNLLFYQNNHKTKLGRSYNLGKTSLSVNYPPGQGCPVPEGCTFTKAMSVDVNSNLYYGVTGVFKSTDEGNTWITLLDPNSPQVEPLQKFRFIEAAPSNPNIIYAGCKVPVYSVTNVFEKRFFKSTDAGSTWTDITGRFSLQNGGTYGILDHPMTSFAIDPLNADRIWISIGGFWKKCGFNRVNASTDGGHTWVDISAGLPDFPVNQIKYREGSNDQLFAATDVGVYYWNAIDSVWHPFRDNLPRTLVSDLEINTCAGKIRASTFGRGLWEAMLPPMDLAVPEQIATNQTWTDTVFKYTDLSIPQNVTLTVKGVLSMAHGRKITIQRGGRLIVDGGTITNLCGTMWDGIEIHGDTSKLQVQFETSLDPNQGTLIVRNKGTLENAWLAVTVKKPGDLAYGGGRVFARQAIFRNNRRAFEFYPYPKLNYSKFVDCTFENTGPLADTVRYKDNLGRKLGTSTYVTMWRTKGIRFQGNRFSGYPGFTPDLRPVAINSFDAIFAVERQCTTTTNGNCTGGIGNTFSDLQVGVEFYTGLAPGLHYCRIEDNTFRNVFRGVIVGGGEFNLVRNNLFLDQPRLANTPTGKIFSVAINVAGSIGTQVFENTVQGPKSLNGSLFPDTWGVWVYNSGVGGTKVQGNIFEGYLVGTESGGDNNSLQIKCNVYHKGMAIVSRSGKLANIGFCQDFKSAAGNDFFDQTFWHPEKHVLYRNTINPGTGTKSLVYSYFKISSAINYMMPISVTNSPGTGEFVFPKQCFDTLAQKSCSIETSTPGGGNQILRIIEINDQIVSLKNQIDDGKTASLIPSLQSANTNAEAEQAIAGSVILSNESLETLIQNKKVNNDWLANVLVQNSPLLPGTLQKWEARDFSLCEKLFGNSQRKVKEAQQSSNESGLSKTLESIFSLELEKIDLQNEILRNTLDTVSWSHDLSSVLENPSLWQDLPEYYSLITKKNNLAPGNQNPEISDFVKIFRELKGANKTESDLNQNQISSLEKIAKSESVLSVLAKSILDFHLGKTEFINPSLLDN